MQGEHAKGECRDAESGWAAGRPQRLHHGWQRCNGSPGGELRHDVALATTNRDAVVLVDRGPKTITCSARAHTATGRRIDQLGQRTSDGLSEEQDDLADQLRRLASMANVTSVELHLDPTPDLVLSAWRGESIRQKW